MCGFAKLLSPKGKLWIVALLLVALQLRYEMVPTSSNFTRKYIWRAPTSSATIHNLPLGLKSFAKPDMASQNRCKKLCRVGNNWIFNWIFISLSPYGKLWIVALLVGTLQIYFRVKFEDVGSISYLNCMVFYPVLYHSAWFNPENMHSLENTLKSLI